MDPEAIGTTTEEEQRPEPSAQERAEMDAARAGYDRMKGVRAAAAAPAPTTEPTPAPSPEPQASETPPADSQPTDTAPAAAPAAAAAPEANPQAAPAAQGVTTADISALRDQLTDIRQQVANAAAAAGTPSAEIRKLQGEIGSINRTLKQLAKSDDAPADLAAALANAEKVAEEFPDIAGPIVKAIKAIQAASAPKPEPEQPEPTPAPTAAPASQYTPEQQKAIADLLDVHKDFFVMKKTPEFQTWFAAQSPEFKSSIASTWNPATLAAMATRFKAEREAQEAKARAEQAAREERRAANDKRLAAAVTPQGTAAETRPTQPSEEDEARKGYHAYKQRKRF